MDDERGEEASFGNVLFGLIGNPKVIIIILVLLTPVLIASFAASEKFFDPVRGRLGDIFGTDFAMRVAAETHEYFRAVGTQIEWQQEDFEAIAARSREIDTYRITIDESFSDPRFGFLNPGWFNVEQHIIFERRGDLFKIQVIPQEVNLSDRALFYESLFRNYRLIPFGIYYIANIDGERYILMYSGRFDGNYMREMSAIRVSANMALYNRLMSYSIENIIDFQALRNRGEVECFQVSGGMREYSIRDENSEDHSDVFLRELRAMPAAYLMKFELPNDNLRRQIKAQFSYNDRRINSNVPLLSDYTRQGL